MLLLKFNSINKPSILPGKLCFLNILFGISSLTYMIIPPHFYFYLICKVENTRQYGTEKLQMCYPVLFLWLLKYQAFLLKGLLGRHFFWKRVNVKVTYNDIVYFFNPSFLKYRRQSVDLREFSHAPKIDFLASLLSRLFEDRGPTSSIYVSTLKDLALLVCCQSNIPFSELWKSTLKFIAFSKLIFK